MEITHHVNLSVSLGLIVRRMRSTRGWSQEELAANAGVDRRYMSDLENGKRNPSLDVMSRLAAALGISVSELMRHAENCDSVMSGVSELKEWLCDNGHDDTVVLENPDYLSAIVGVSDRGNLIYSYSLMVSHLIVTEGMGYEEAAEFIDYNTVRALPYMGDGAPVISYDILG